MGCDIHAMIERKAEDLYAWEYWLNAGDPDIERDYELFGMLAGVRGDDEPISRDRGLPEATCDEFIAYAEKWSMDAHNHGYVTLREVQEREPQPDFESWLLLRREMERVADRYDGDPDAVRLVFFFDN